MYAFNEQIIGLVSKTMHIEYAILTQYIFRESIYLEISIILKYHVYNVVLI